MNITNDWSLKGLTGKGLTGTAAVLALTLGLNLVGPHRAYAAPHQLTVPGANDLGVTILSPDPHVALGGLKPVEISAFYQGSPANQVIAIELFIDGAKAATKTLSVPETRGVVSFLVDAGQIAAGTHQIVVRATAADQEVQSAKSAFTFNGMDGNVIALSAPNLSGPSSSQTAEPSLSSGLPPTVRLMSPTPDGRVQGVVTLHVEATDPSGKAPYVSLFIDKTFKTLRNYAPYEFEWDTTQVANGYHTIEAYGYNDTPHIGHAKSIQLYVNNPGGQTGIRHDLLDGQQSAKVRAIKPGRAAKKQAVLAAASVVEAPPTPAKMASLLPAHARSTAEIVRHLAAGPGSLRFGTLDFATELSAPFASAASQPAAAVSQPAASKVQTTAPVRHYKPMPPIVSSQRHVSDTAAANPSDFGALSLTPASVSGRKIALPQIASIKLPQTELASPFVALPSLKPLAGARVKTPLNLHTQRVHLPLSMVNLLRSVGQRTLLFNHTTVMMDRPLTARSRVLFGPLRQIFEQGGGTLLWQPRTGTVRAKSPTQDILLTVGDNHAQVNAKRMTLDGKPYLLLGRTMVPLSFIAVAMDANVQFDPATGHLVVTSRN